MTDTWTLRETTDPKRIVRVEFLDIDYAAAEALDLPAFMMAGRTVAYCADGSVIFSRDGITWKEETTEEKPLSES